MGGAQERFYQLDVLADFGKRCLEAAGAAAVAATSVVENLLWANERGINSHGLVRLPVYQRRLASGAMNAKAQPRVVKTKGAVSLIDGEAGLGAVSGVAAVELLRQTARKTGVAAVGVRKSSHFGSAGYFTDLLSLSGFIGIAVFNSESNMAPFGGRSRFFGTNPLSIGIPRGNRLPLIIDMATSTVARGRIILAAQRDEEIPEGRAIDVEGRVTRSAKRTLEGVVVPFGGPKGSALAFMIDVLSGVLTGSAFGRDIKTLQNETEPQGVGHFFIAVDIDAFMPASLFAERLDAFVGQLKSTPAAEGFDEVMAPGEPELRVRDRILASGIAIDQEVQTQLNLLGRELGVEFPLHAASKERV